TTMIRSIPLMICVSGLNTAGSVPIAYTYFNICEKSWIGAMKSALYQQKKS
ncbi:unnamed protein product, partial [Ceratitis capitata]